MTKFVVFYGSIRCSPACMHIIRVSNRVVEGFHRCNILHYIIKCVLGDERRVLKREDVLLVIPMLVKLGVTVHPGAWRSVSVQGIVPDIVWFDLIVGHGRIPVGVRREDYLR